MGIIVLPFLVEVHVFDKTGGRVESDLLQWNPYNPDRAGFLAALRNRGWSPKYDDFYIVAEHVNPTWRAILLLPGER